MEFQEVKTSVIKIFQEIYFLPTVAPEMSLALLSSERFARQTDRPEFNFFSVAAAAVVEILSLTSSAQPN